MTKATRIIIGLALSTTVMTAVTMSVSAGSTEPRPSARALVTKVVPGKICKVAVQTDTASLSPTDDSTSDNTPAASITFKKNCGGIAIAQFTGETTGNIHLDGKATCTGTGGFTTNPCTVGQVVTGLPGHIFLDNDSATNGAISNAAQFYFVGLNRGIWRFDILPGTGSTGTLGYRTTVVTAYFGG